MIAYTIFYKVHKKEIYKLKKYSILLYKKIIGGSWPMLVSFLALSPFCMLSFEKRLKTFFNYENS